MNKISERVNNFCFKLENHSNLITASIIIGLIILGFDMLYITPKFIAGFHGLDYSNLSKNPFDFSYSTPLRYRILPSLIGYITFLRGDLFFIVPLIFSLIFISTIYWYYRRKNFSPIDAILFTGLIAFSCTLFIQLQAPGYTDVIFYFFIFLSFAFVNNYFLSAVSFSLALLTHESCLFILPGLLLYSRYSNKNNGIVFFKHSISLIIAIFPLILYRHWVAQNVQVEYDLNFYFSIKNISFSLKKVLPLFPAGLFYAFKLFWFFPVYILYKTLKRKEYDFFYIIIAIVICDFTQLIIAYDITRMLCLGFPAILICAEKMKEELDSTKFTHFLLVLTLMNFLIIQHFASCDAVNPMLPMPYNWLINNFI